MRTPYVRTQITREGEESAMGKRMEPTIQYRFADRRIALEAMETFDELGYDPELIADGTGTKVAIRVVNEDLTSALEIGQAYGGILLDEYDTDGGHRRYEKAYNLEGTSDSSGERTTGRRKERETRYGKPDGDDLPYPDLADDGRRYGESAEDVSW